MYFIVIARTFVQETMHRTENFEIFLSFQIEIISVLFFHFNIPNWQKTKTKKYTYIRFNYIYLAMRNIQFIYNLDFKLALIMFAKCFFPVQPLPPLKWLQSSCPPHALRTAQCEQHCIYTTPCCTVFLEPQWIFSI